MTSAKSIVSKFTIFERNIYTYLMAKLNTLKVSVLSAFLMGSVVFSPGCKKSEFDTSLGTVAYYGDYDQGGCGWVIEIGTQAFEGQNIPADYLVDQLPVKLTYKPIQGTPDCVLNTDVNGKIYVHKIEPVQ